MSVPRKCEERLGPGNEVRADRVHSRIGPDLTVHHLKKRAASRLERLIFFKVKPLAPEGRLADRGHRNPLHPTIYELAE
jgi:hypothetical protein